MDRREDALFLGPGGAGKSHLAQAIAHAAILQGHRVLYREAHVLLEQLADAAAEDLLEVVMRHYERASTLLTSNRVVEDWEKLLGARRRWGPVLDRLLHHERVLKCGPKSWRTKTATE